MKKKYLAAILGVMMAATSVTACGAATTEKTTSTAESSENKDAEDTTADSTKSTDSDNSDSNEDANADADKESFDKGDSDEEDVTYGEVKSVETGKITIAVGTMKEMGGNGGTPGGEQGEAPEKPDSDGSGNASDDSADKSDAETTSDNSSDAENAESDSKDTESDKKDSKEGDSTDNGESQKKPDGDNTDGNGGAPEEDQGETPSMLDLTGDEMTVTVTDDTVITKESTGGPGGAPGEAPEKPDGDNGNGESPEKPANDSIAPEKPDGDNGNGQAPGSTQGDASDGNNSQSETIELSGIQEGDIVAITTDDDGNALTIKVQSTVMGGGQGAPGGAPGGQSQGVDGYDAVNTYDSDTEVSDTSLESTGTDENAALVSSGANVTFNNVDITRNSSDSTGGDNSSFYGVGAALLATEGNAYVKGGTVNTDAAGGAGLFAYGDGTVYAADTTIKTTQDTSGGIHAAGGGKLYAWELNVETNGESAAAIRSDRGGGTMVVDGGTYTSNGEGSPAVYCTADIAVKDATLTANGSEAVCIEGLNSLHLFDCDLTGNMSDLSQNDSIWTVILYQSMSGDSEVGNSTFQMDGGTLTSQNGGVFYTTNTESDITLNAVDITYNNDNEYFLRCTGNNNERGWGESGANGADCDFTAISQDMEGDVIWDTISQLDFYMTDGSNLTGVIIDDESFAGNGGDGYCNVYVNNDSTWTVTGDSTVSTLSNAGTIVDDSGKTVTIKGTDGTVYAEGDSDYTITVDKYEETADTSDSETIASWSDYEVEKPDTL
ncbi:hypothetical protein HFM85_05000 [Blautia schinkii]|uniref:hypothetical protein n=1 Tax=Blautia schinkii TaxID=180164 RepID=UPI00156E9735|nr:hypothetical protein [Blautia schinkii]NSG81757.1 hypothetical protein [Blautia schinkii]NSK22358.1 hypothetical protein [Blautia schinkii]NSK25286.1 hypothetical protein [Blautia schinkii]NSK33381.1 hypothetical protein [Blautia schinkii]NSK51127.1 hypothetical protein [Blautia schinkii]